MVYFTKLGDNITAFKRDKIKNVSLWQKNRQQMTRLIMIKRREYGNKKMSTKVDRHFTVLY